MKINIRRIILGITIMLLYSSCDKFIFGNVEVDYENNALTQKKMPQTIADHFKAPVVTEAGLENPDPNGALKDWATCLVLFKEGHSHGGDKFHGNLIYDRAPWKQEELTVIRNTPNGIKVEVDTLTTVTHYEKVAGKKGPEYIRIIGGPSKLWGLCLFFFDKDGQPINDRILEHSDQYQIFFTISELDDKKKPFAVRDVRYRHEGQPADTIVESQYFKDKKNFEQLAEATTKLFHYTYRDTWTAQDMADGVRDLFNQKLLPPFERFHTKGAQPRYDQDYVGLKGHLKFNIAEDVDPIYEEWHVPPLNGNRPYRRDRRLLPYFYMAVKVMRCEKGKKTVIPRPKDDESGSSPAGATHICADHNVFKSESGWKEMIRFNIPIKVYTSTFDTDPTRNDYNDPYYYHLGKEIGLSSKEAYDAIYNVSVHGNSSFGSWFL